MSSIIDSYYVNYMLTQPEADMYARYFEIKQEMKENVALKVFDDKVRTLFSSQTSNKEIDNYLSIIDKIVNSGALEKVGKEIVDQISLSDLSYQSLSKNKLQELENNAKLLSSALVGLEDSISYLIAAFTGADGIEALMINPTLKQKVKRLINNSNASFIVDGPQYNKLSAAFKGQYDSFIKKLEGLSALDISSLKVSDPNFVSIAGSLASYVNRLAGIASEFIAEKAFSADKIAKVLSSSLAGSGVSISTISRVGDDKSEYFRVGTKDLSINLTPEGGSLQMTLPSAGITLKRTNNSDGSNYKNIHLKTTKIGNLLAAVHGNIVTSAKINAFYNLYANYQRNDIPGLGVISSDTINEMYGFFHSAFLTSAIAGSLTASDFSFIMIINDKVFTIKDILSNLSYDSYGNPKGLTFLNGNNLKKHQKSVVDYHVHKATYKSSMYKGEMTKFKRSQKVINYINSRPINMSLNINLTKARSALK